MSPFEFQLRIFLLMPQVKVKNSDTRCFIRSLTKNVRSLGTFFVNLEHNLAVSNAWPTM
jgi:hypothetical protein